MYPYFKEDNYHLGKSPRRWQGSRVLQTEKLNNRNVLCLVDVNVYETILEDPYSIY